MVETRRTAVYSGAHKGTKQSIVAQVKAARAIVIVFAGRFQPGFISQLIVFFFSQ